MDAMGILHLTVIIMNSEILILFKTSGRAKNDPPLSGIITRIYSKSSLGEHLLSKSGFLFNNIYHECANTYLCS